MANTGKVIRMEGYRAGFLTVLRRAGSTGRRPNNSGTLAKWLCRCDCGEQVVVRGDHLRASKKLSCNINGHHHHTWIGVVAREEKNIWNQMLLRCYDKDHLAYKHYGAKGIRVCKEWKNSFEQFLSDMGPRPSKDYSVDRFPNQTGNYEPSNCRWATDRQQAQNTTACIHIEVDGQRVPLIEHTRKLGVNNRMVRKRLARGWSLEEALTIPSKPIAVNQRTAK